MPNSQKGVALSLPLALSLPGHSLVSMNRRQVDPGDLLDSSFNRVGFGDRRPGSWRQWPAAAQPICLVPWALVQAWKEGAPALEAGPTLQFARGGPPTSAAIQSPAATFQFPVPADFESQFVRR